MKKLAIFVMALTISVTAFAQGAFSHMSIGLEVGTTGAGIQMSVPLVSNHLNLSLGYNYLGFPYKATASFNTSGLASAVSEINSEVASANQKLAPYGEHLNTTFQTQFSQRTNLDIAARARLSTVKMLFEYYPSAKSGFHITAGAYIGMSPNLVEVNINAEDKFWNDVDSFEKELNSLRSEVNALKAKYPEQVGDVEIPTVASSIKVSMGNNTYQVNRRGTLKASVKAWQVRPYLGVGFGKSIPDGHWAFVGELGVWYHGKPTLVSDNQVPYDASAQKMNFNVIDKIEKVPVWPVLSFKVLYKIF